MDWIETRRRAVKRIQSCTTTPTDTPVGYVRSESWPVNNPRKMYMVMKCEKKQFPILSSSIESMIGIGTICSQDFKNVPSLLSEQYLHLLSSNSISIFTTKDLSKYTEDIASDNEQFVSAEEVVDEIKCTKEFTLIIADDRLDRTIYEFLKIDDNRIPIGVLFVKNIDTCDLRDLPNVFCSDNVTVSEKEDKRIRKDADILLSRCAHGIMSAMYSQLKKELTFFDGEKDSFLDICDLIQSSFQRNKIPQNEWPNIPEEDFAYPQNIDQAIKSCLCEKEITGCLKKRGALHIFIDSSMAVTDTESKIRDTMLKNGVSTCEAVFKYGNIKRFCSSGNIACSDTGCTGTLGGFVKIETTVSSETKPKTELDVDSVFALTAGNSSTAKAAVANQTTQNTNPKSKEPLVALISRHVAMEHLNKYLCVGPNQRKLGPIKGMNFSETLDIYPVKVDDENIWLCDTRFKTELGVNLYANRNIVDTLLWANVHIWGQRIFPGLGIIVEKDIQGSDGNMIIIRNRHQNKEFAVPGDSGAMVCYADAHSEQLYAVAMLIGPYLGEPTPVRYIAQVLDDALCVLSALNKCTLDVCRKKSE